MKELFDKLNEVFIYAKEYPNEVKWDLTCAILKMHEEFGELSEVALILNGSKPHKTIDEPIIGEIADNMITVMDIFSHITPDISFSCFKETLNNSFYVLKDISNKEYDRKYFLVHIFKDKHNKFHDAAILSSKYSSDGIESKGYALIMLLREMANQEGYSEQELILTIQKKLEKWKRCGRKTQK